MSIDGNEVSALSDRMSEFREVRVERTERDGEVRVLCERTRAFRDGTEANSLGIELSCACEILRTVKRNRFSN